MKYFSVLMMFLTIQTFGESPKKEENFDDIKSNIVKMLDMRITKIQEEKVCVNAAKSKDEIRSCREKMKKEMSSARASRKAKMQEKKASK